MLNKLKHVKGAVVMEEDSLREMIHELCGVFWGQQQLPLVGLGHAVTLEAILAPKQNKTTIKLFYID